MPNKTIYVTEADLPVFNRAQELAGNNLSATIAEALRRFIEAEEAKDKGFEEITIKVGENGTYQKKRFIGKELARTQNLIDDHPKVAKVWIVYETAKHRYALYTKEMKDPTDSLMQAKISQKMMEQFGIDQEESFPFSLNTNKYQLDVFDAKEDLKPHIPDALYELLNETPLHDDFLDI
ncbi:EXLDI protein [Camelliibacillus cellulosilyticus]|uniref:EXLDI protein n=1 Tax=Camelliibacillus cellulosilyticus TaxID=2174486 RepID=A0ABV9GNF3_9BACL